MPVIRTTHRSRICALLAVFGSITALLCDPSIGGEQFSVSAAPSPPVPAATPALWDDDVSNKSPPKSAPPKEEKEETNTKKPPRSTAKYTKINPRVSWGQRPDTLYLTINLRQCGGGRLTSGDEKPKLVIKKTRMSLFCADHQRAQKVDLRIKFLRRTIPESAKETWHEDKLVITLTKYHKEPCWKWLVKERETPKWLQKDFDIRTRVFPKGMESMLIDTNRMVIGISFKARWVKKIIPWENGRAILTIGTLRSASL